MKVFTVGLDQKALPAADAAVIKEGKESPPPVYGSMHVPLPQLPPVPPTVLVKKSRGYKGILLVMLAVFIMAIFALTLSEIAYNRHREENYFRLRWAEMKHRLGYGGHRHHGAFPGRENGPYDGFGYRRFGNGDGVFSLSKTKDIMDAPASTTSTPPPTTTTSAEQQESSSSNSGESRIIFQPSEQRPPFPASRLFPLFPQSPADASSTAAMRDARLQFLRTVLQKIKQRAEAMGFDGTMQVSVIEVEPPTADEEGKPQGAPLLTNHFTSTSNIGKGLAGLPWAQQQSQQQPQSREGPFSFRPLPQHQLNGLFFPPRPFIDPKSSAFLDGFGETHQPSLFQQNQFMEQQQQRAQSHQQPEDQENEIDSSSQQQQQPPSMESNPMAGFSPFGAFRPPQHPINPMSNNWQIVSPHQPPHIQLTRPVPTAFDRWPGSNSGPQEDMSGGINPSLALPPPPPPPMSAVDGISGSGSNGMDAGNNPNEPPAPPSVMDSSSPASVSGPSGNASSSSANPSQEVMGEVYGRKFGRLLHDIIANRIEGMHKLNQQLQSPSMGFGGSKLVSN